MESWPIIQPKKMAIWCAFETNNYPIMLNHSFHFNISVIKKLFVRFTKPPSPNVKVFLFSKKLLKKIKKKKEKRTSISNFLYLGPFFLLQVIIYTYLRAAVQTYPSMWDLARAVYMHALTLHGHFITP
jgi:hypothetical protein